MTTSPLGRMRLLQLVSSSLPIGAFTYSQGLEWAVESGWISSKTDLQEWIGDALRTNISHVEVPLFKRLFAAYMADDSDMAEGWVQYLLATRETSELKIEEQQRGRAFARLLPELGLSLNQAVHTHLQRAQLAGFAYVAVHWEIDAHSAIQAYIWAWLENLTLAGVKLIPLGQTAGQKIIYELSDQVIAAVELGLSLDDDEIGFSCSAQAIASSLHETQYTRLYRS